MDCQCLADHGDASSPFKRLVCWFVRYGNPYLIMSARYVSALVIRYRTFQCPGLTLPAHGPRKRFESSVPVRAPWDARSPLTRFDKDLRRTLTAFPGTRKVRKYCISAFCSFAPLLPRNEIVISWTKLSRCLRKREYQRVETGRLTAARRSQRNPGVHR
jgi:hypothetical protein